MKKISLSILLIFFSLSTLKAQKNAAGIINDAVTNIGLKDVFISLKKTGRRVVTNEKGAFLLENVLEGEYVLVVEKRGYVKQQISIKIHNKSIVLGTITMDREVSLEESVSIVILADDELSDDEVIADNISGLLQSSKDTYSKAVAFEWSSSFYKVRGLNSEHATVLINGVRMNKLFNGRPQWNNWGGLNDVLRNQEFNNGLSPSSYTFGGLLGATNINTRASEYRATTKVSYASSNRSYTHRIMAMYSSGLLKNGWAFAFSGSFRKGQEGFNEGTFYNSYAAFCAVEKKINENHSINFTGIFSPNKRGKSSPNTQEVYDLKGIKYNEYWGWLNGKKVNSRIKEVVEPIFMLNHYWKINKKTSLTNSVSYQFGKVGNSRLDYTFGSNPSAAYYQNLPSFFIERDEFENAFESRQDFLNNGQLNWERIYDANLTNNRNNLPAAYILYEDRNDTKEAVVNSVLAFELSNNVSFNGKVSYRNLRTENYAKVIDVLGSSVGYLDFDRFGDTPGAQQNNLQNSNRIVNTDDRFKYNYILNGVALSAFIQAKFNYKKIDFYIAAKAVNAIYGREGLYENGSFPGNLSLGESKEVGFFDGGVKAGATYKITGRHLISMNSSYTSQAPTLKNTFFNARENNDIITNLNSEKIIGADINYVLRSPKLTGKISGFYTNVKDATEIGFFFADGLGGIGADDNAFVQEILTGIDRIHFGVELGFSAQITTDFKLKGALNIGQYTYANNPNLQLTSDAFEAIDLGESNLKNHKLATGPQQAFSIGFEYRSPAYWWFGITANYLANTYVDVTPLTRTRNFYSDTDGLPFNDYDETVARELLKQERFSDYTTVNTVGGKSWKVERYYIGFFMGVSNLLNNSYRTGGYEQGRNANFRTLRDDNLNEIKVFGSKYWYGRGATYFANVSFRF